MTIHRIYVLLVMAATSVCATAQQTPTASTTCRFDDGKQVVVRYAPVETPAVIPDGKPWAPGNGDLTMFSETPLVVAGSEAPVGAYRLYLIGDKDQWKIAVNRAVSSDEAYNAEHDVVRAPTIVENLPSKQPTFQAYFGHVAPKQCNLRLDFGKTRATLEIKEK
jgi:hypothetical protein